MAEKSRRSGKLLGVELRNGREYRMGPKTIFTPNDLEEFFQLLYPILKTTPYDDPVLPDFGEIKLNNG